MKNILRISIFLGAVILTAWFWVKKNTPVPVSNNAQMTAEKNIQENTALEANNVTPSYGFTAPLDRAGERVTKKPFGTYITPQTSPVQPERFRGYHTGTDFETFPEEAEVDVRVKAVCDGKLLVSRFASGYGGIAVESCDIDNQPVTVIYGHLKLTSVRFKAGDPIKAGDDLAILGKGYSPETDGERKHLHLGIHKGTAINILGYVQDQKLLVDWIDPCLYVCH